MKLYYKFITITLQFIPIRQYLLLGVALKSQPKISLCAETVTFCFYSVVFARHAIVRVRVMSLFQLVLWVGRSLYKAGLSPSRSVLSLDCSQAGTSCFSLLPLVSSQRFRC
uniref:Secreted protein n=1 Tax=Ascaris lumbricoides TaxID=6252 RepID=A0A0M3HUY4_ASCLU